MASIVDWSNSYHRLLARHAWTAATLCLAFGWVRVVMAAGIGLILGLNLRIVICRDPARNRGRSAVIVVLLVGLIGLSAIQTWCNKVEDARIESLRNDPLSPDRAWLLAHGRSEDQRAIALNPTCPSEVLASLAESPDWSIRAYVGAHSSTPGNVLWTLKSDPVDAVRMTVLRNPALPREEPEKKVEDQAPERERRDLRKRARVK